LLATYVLGYSPIASGGTWDVGPTYYFVVAPLLVALAVRGVRASRNLFPGDTPGRRFVSFIPIIGLGIGMLTLVPLHLLRLGVLAREIEAPWRAIADADLGNSVVILPSATQLRAAGYSLGYPYEVHTPRGIAHLIRPFTLDELSVARRYLGEALPTYALDIDSASWRGHRERRYRIAPLVVPSLSGPGRAGVGLQ
jgi:hypothetical protein